MLFGEVIKIAQKNNIKNIIDGTNFDDLNTYRPGRKALRELGIISPFVEFEITKAEIRSFAKENKIEVFNKPSTPCLATRFPYNMKLIKEKLDVVEKAEKYLKQHGFSNCRARMHNEITRIEIPPQEFSEFLSKKDEIIKNLKILGLKYITLDLEGLRSSSMDE